MDRWLFIHIMKTAGTSFRTMLEKRFGAAVYPTRSELKDQPRGFYLRPTEFVQRLANGRVDLSGRQVVCGHYAAAFEEVLPGAWRTVTFLREPVSRALSMIAHRHNKQRGLLDFRTRLPVAEYLEDDTFVQGQILNYQTKVFAAGPTDVINWPYPVDAAAFDRAKERLLAVDCVGLTEAFEPSVRMFERLSGITFEEPILHANRNRRYVTRDEDVARVRALVGYDVELYEIARQKMRAQLAPAA